MLRLRLSFVPMLAFAWSGTALAQTPAAAPPPAAPAAPGAATPAAGGAKPASTAAGGAKPASTAPGASANNVVKKDPRGIQGISPFWEAVNKGDAAYAARDFEGAIKAYREAIEKEANNALGHYRLGEAMLAKGDLAEAEQSWQTGLRFCGRDERLRAKLLFVLADLRERQHNWEEADGRWKEYEKQAQSQPDAKAFPATAVERQKRIAEWKQLNADSAQVRERIDKRLKETEESMRKSSK